MSVTTTDLGAARVVTWESPGKLNAWNLETIEAIADAIEAAGAEPAVRCVVARGAGENFSAGDDLDDALAADRETWAATIGAFQRLTRVTLESPLPVLAAIDGVCVGGALEFAASCDARIATERARFATPEVGIGLVATNAGTLLLPYVLGETAARDVRDEGDAQRAPRRPLGGRHDARGAVVRGALRLRGLREGPDGLHGETG